MLTLYKNEELLCCNVLVLRQWSYGCMLFFRYLKINGIRPENIVIKF